MLIGYFIDSLVNSSIFLFETEENRPVCLDDGNKFAI